MTITAIKQQVKNSERVSVFADGKYGFSLSLNQLVESKLKIGVEIDENELKKLVKLSAEGKLKARALEWLLSRPHSEKEFKDYLRRKKAEPELIETWAEEFSQKKYLNDETFAKWWVESRRSSKNSSNRKLYMELRQKGIDKAIIDEQLIDTQQDEEQALKNLIAKKSKLTKYKSDPHKFTSYLISQGFSYSLVKEILNK